jgi:hypothetical protein
MKNINKNRERKLIMYSKLYFSPRLGYKPNFLEATAAEKKMTDGLRDGRFVQCTLGWSKERANMNTIGV